MIPPRPIVPGERRYRDGDRVRHARWGDGIVITSKLTRDDEEVQVAFKDPQVGRKTMLGEPREPRAHRLGSGRLGVPGRSARAPAAAHDLRLALRACMGERRDASRSARRPTLGGSGRIGWTSPAPMLG